MKIIITIISSLIFFSNILYAETNIAYFDVDKVLSTSKVGKSLTSQIRKLNKSNTEKFNKIEEKLKDEDKALLAKKNILSKEDFIKEFNKLKMDVAKYKKTRNTNIKETSIKGVNGTKKLLSGLKIYNMNIAIIPARGGSKRIPRKNIKHILSSIE